MTTRRLAVLLAVAVPPLILTIVGITHPLHLTASTAEYWRNLHIALLPIFPLLGLAPWLVVRGHHRLLTIATVILAFVFGVFYTALDVLAGIGAGGLRLDGMGMATGIGILFSLARALGGVGAIAFIGVCLLVGVISVRSDGLLALPGALLVLAGSALLFRDHIYLPWGVIGQLCLLVGWLLLVFVKARSTKPSIREAAPAARAA